MRTTKKVRNPETAPMWRKVPELQRQRLFNQIADLVRWGFKAWYIAELCGCTVANVYQTCAKLQLRISDYREGRNVEARGVIRDIAPTQVKYKRAGG